MPWSTTSPKIVDNYEQPKADMKTNTAPMWTWTKEEKEINDKYVNLWKTGVWNSNDANRKEFNQLEAKVLATMDKMIREQMQPGHHVYRPVYNALPFVSIREEIIVSCLKSRDGTCTFISNVDSLCVPTPFIGYARLQAENNSSGGFPRGFIFPRFINDKFYEDLIRAIFHNQEVMFVPLVN